MRLSKHIRLVIFCTIGAISVCAGVALSREVHLHLSPRTPDQFEASKLLVQANQLLKEKQPFKARTLIAKAESLWPEEPHVHFYEGVCYQQMGDFPHAISQYQLVMNADNSLSECLADMGTCYQLMGDYNQAIDCFNQYLKTDPRADDAQQIKNMIGALRTQAGKQAQADPGSEDYLDAVLSHGRIERWPLARLPIRVFISNGTDQHGNPVSGFQEQYNELLLGALNTWVKASNYRLAYVLVDDVKNADLICTWTDQVGFSRDAEASVEQGNTRVLTRPTPDGVATILKVNLVILLVNPTSGKYISAEDVKKTCLHELGHALGFAGHSTNNHDVMFYAESPAVWAALTHRDENTMARLYGDYPAFSWRLAGPR